MFAIPKRQNLDIEPETELSDEELRAKEKRMLEIKKMIALQSLQHHQIDEATSLNSAHNYGGGKQANGAETHFEREKKAREQVGAFDSFSSFVL